MTDHQKQWDQLQAAFVTHRIPQALFFVGPLHCAVTDFTTRLMQRILCQKNQNEPCLECLNCRMVLKMEHPDVNWIKPDKVGGAIKIDQIRELQHTAFLTPQRSTYRLIAIEAADRMNTASANALLKILEEPAQHTIFILIAQQLSTVLPTILSRCQVIRFSSHDDSYTNNFLMLGEHYPKESDRAQIMDQSESILDGLITLIEGKQHPCQLASQWSSFEIHTMLWFLYLVFAQLQNMFFNKEVITGPGHHQLMKLSTLLHPVLIFMQIDKINTILRKLSHNINVNQTLVLEHLLFGILEE